MASPLSRLLLCGLLVAPGAQAADGVEVRLVDDRGQAVDTARSGVEMTRTPPARLADDGSAPPGENSFRFVLQTPVRWEGAVEVRSLRGGGQPLDRLVLRSLATVPCPDGAGAAVVCRSTPPLRMALDLADRMHPAALGRSLQAELGGQVVLEVGGRKAAAARVLGPRQAATGPVERLRARLRVLLVRERRGGGPPFGSTDRMALSLARGQVERANAIWGQCGVSFGPPDEVDMKLVDPPGPSMLAVGCGGGLPASGGEVRVKVDGREIALPLAAGEAPRQVARRLAGAIEALGLRADVSDNLRIGPGAAATSDVLVRRRDGALALVSSSGPASTDPTLTVCLGAVDFSDGLQHFTDVDAIAGSLEERTLLRAFDDGDPRTIEVFLVPSFATGGRVGESFIGGDRSSLGNMIIEDRAGVRADQISFALAHELGHVLLDVPGHSDDFGVDTPSRLMDSDAADPSPFGPRRLTLAECERAVRQSGPRAPTPLLSAWPLGDPPRRGRR